MGWSDKPSGMCWDFEGYLDSERFFIEFSECRKYEYYAARSIKN